MGSRNGIFYRLRTRNAVGSRRAAWRVITSTEQKETFKGKEQLVSHAKEYVAKVEDELQKICDGILALMDKELIPSPGTDDLKVFYYKMQGDYYRHLAEVATDGTKSKAGEDACAACAEATKIAEKDLVVTYPVRLAMALSSVFHSEVPQNPNDVAGGMHVGKNDLDDVSVVAQRQIPIDQIVQKTVETPQLQCLDSVMHVAEKTVEIQQLDVVEKIVETPETQTFQGTQTFVSCNTAEQTLDVPVPEMVELPTIVSQDRIQQRTLEQIVDTQVPQIVEELAEASKVFSQDRVQQRFGGQTIETPAISLAGKVVEVPDIQMRGRASPTDMMTIRRSPQAHSSRVRATVAQMRVGSQRTRRESLS